MADTAEAHPEESSGKYAWIVVERDGETREVDSIGQYEMKQLQDIVGGDFRQVAVSRMPEHRLAMAVRSVAATEENMNNAVTAWLGGISIPGTVVIGQRRSNDDPIFKRQRDGWRYMIPFLRTEAAEVAAGLRSAFRK